MQYEKHPNTRKQLVHKTANRESRGIHKEITMESILLFEPRLETRQERDLQIQQRTITALHTPAKSFKDDLLQITEELKFRKINTSLQTRLRKFYNEKSILVPADKITNYYSVAPQQYRRPMNGNITATYQKAEQDAQYTTNSEAKAIAENFHLVDRIQVLAPELAYKTLKDHKESSQNYPTCRSINSNKSEIA